MILLNCVQYQENNFTSIVKENNNYIKIFWNEKNEYMFEDILEKEKELNNCFVYFYEQKQKEEEKQKTKQNSINNLNNYAISNNINNNMNINNLKIIDTNKTNNNMNNNNLNRNYNNKHMY